MQRPLSTSTRKAGANPCSHTPSIVQLEALSAAATAAFAGGISAVLESFEEQVTGPRSILRLCWLSPITSPAISTAASPATSANCPRGGQVVDKDAELASLQEQLWAIAAASSSLRQSQHHRGGSADSEGTEAEAWLLMCRRGRHKLRWSCSVLVRR